jgi:single-stranded-DNA-specific exonuclease
LSHSRWCLLPPAPDKGWVSTAGLSPLIAQLLYNRGLTDASQLESFIAADARLANDPALLPDIHPAVTRIYRALLTGEKIAIYGDFDTDGITATSLFVRGLSMLNCQAIPYIPHRLTEGYGLKTAALESLHRQGVSLVITVDCGITALPQVKRAKHMGLDIIITDHHTPTDAKPPAVAVIDPKLPDSGYPFPDLAGVGVAFKLLQALFQGLGKERQLEELIDLVALGTVADMVPLLGENRYLVRQGLKAIKAGPRLGIAELTAQCRLNIADLEADGISWIIAPRLNAAGRLDHAISSYQLLMTESPEEAHGLATWLEQKNAERQSLTAKSLTKAREQVVNRGISPLLMVGDADFPAGICGLVASRLAEEFYRPAVVIRTGDQFSSGSCRSIPEFNIIRALTRCRQLFSHFGGHSQAAGFTLPTRNLPRLEQALLELATGELAGLELRPKLEIDAEVNLSELGGDTFPMIQKLAPFGQGNPEPAFLSRRVEVMDCRTMGDSGEHLKLKLRQGGTVWDGVGFGLGSYCAEVARLLNVVYNLEADHWGGDGRLRLNILDFEPELTA